MRLTEKQRDMVRVAIERYGDWVLNSRLASFYENEERINDIILLIEKLEEKEECEHKYCSHSIYPDKETYNCITCNKDFMKDKPERIKEIDINDFYPSTTYLNGTALGSTAPYVPPGKYIAEIIPTINQIIKRLNNL